MERIHLDTLLSGPPDTELRQFRVLQSLKELYSEFSHNRLYPGLADLITLAQGLENLLQKMEDLQQHSSHDVQSLRLHDMKLEFHQTPDQAEVQRMRELASWALPLVRKAIEEGAGIYSFVESHITIEEVGIIPAYHQEGYWFVPELKAGLLHLLRFEISLFRSSSEHYRTLKTVHLDAIDQHLVCIPPESVKLTLMERFHDLPNPATYRCEVDMEFPYAETVLPIAKRKLIAHLAA